MYKPSTTPNQPPCKDIETLRDKLHTCLINESSIITCAITFTAYKQCLHEHNKTRQKNPIQ